jgi:hypothetical protein
MVKLFLRFGNLEMRAVSIHVSTNGARKKQDRPSKVAALPRGRRGGDGGFRYSGSSRLESPEAHGCALA